jgi:hypothetical protein
VASTIVATEKPISSIFSNDFVFHIPSYQRPYAWTTEQARELYDDLIEFMGSQAGPVEDMASYFLGSIVLIKKDGDTRAEVVDGQQRLTTLTLLLSAIRAGVNGQDRSDLTQLIYERGSPIRGTHDRFRLSLRERDREFFQDHVQREDGFAKLLKLMTPTSDSQRNIFANGKFFAERIEAMPQPDRLRLAQFIVTRCYLVVVATPDLDSAYRIFSVLNSRGLDLSATDILKAEIIGALPANHRDPYTLKWESIEEDLGRDAFGELFAHIRMVYRKAKPHGTLLKEFKDHVVAKNTSAMIIDEILLPMAANYEFITDNAYESTKLAERINEHLKWLNRLEFADWLPPMLKFAMRERNNPDHMLSFVADLERLAYWMLITRRGINDRIERFSRLTSAIEDCQTLDAVNSPLQLSSIEQKATLDVLSGPFYDSLNARARTSVILRLDSLLSGGGATYDYSEITLEHVCPQNAGPGSCWIKWIPQQAKRSDCVHKLGNLALLTRKKNSAASNYDFDRKKTAYFTRGGVSPFALTTQVVQQTEWTEAVIEKRQTQLLSTLSEHWRLS